jgi:hypothetical protein
MLGLRMVQILIDRQFPPSSSTSNTTSSAMSQLDFSNPVNSGYRSFFF